MDESQQIPTETTEEWVFDFHGATYIVCVTVSSRVLTIQIEDEQHGDRWSADFTAQYIEEITQKAGNYKKFHVFTTMLTSAFAKNSDSVYVDLLTLSDIEVLKAKKSGGQISSATASLARNDALRRSHSHKRYLVLTYTGEFDRVHYPLPLSFEETPNAIALQKTIKRLREKLKEKRIADLEPASEREKELRQIVAQLRQDNTELRHRLRHSGSKTHNASISHSNNDISMMSHMSPGTQTLINADYQAMNNNNGQNSYLNNAELVKENIKLRKMNDDLKLKLKEHVALLEKLKNDHQRERIKWQNRLGGVSLVDAAVSEHSHKLKTRAEEQLIAEMKKKIVFLEKELKMERLSRGRPSVTHSSVHSSGVGGFTNTTNRSLSASSGGRGGGSVGRGGVSRSPSPSINNNVISASRIKRTNITNSTTSYSASNSASGRRHSSPSVTQSQLHRYQSPYRQQTTQASSSPSNYHNYYNNSYNYNNTMSPSSSLGGRFDPTAYQRSKETQKTLKSQQNRYKNSHNSNKEYNYNSDSGYSSAGSSTHSRRSVRSQRSDNSQTKKTRKSSSKRSDDYLDSDIAAQKNKSLIQSVSSMTSSAKKLTTKKKIKSMNNNSDSEVSDGEAFHSSKTSTFSSQALNNYNSNSRNSNKNVTKANNNNKNNNSNNNRAFDLFDNDDDDDDDFDQLLQKKHAPVSTKSSSLMRSSADSINNNNTNNNDINNKKHYNETQYKCESFDLAEDATTVQSTRHTTGNSGQTVLRVSRDTPIATNSSHTQSNLNNNVRSSKDNISETLTTHKSNNNNNAVNADLPKNDSGLSDIDKRLQALASYLESARANVVKT